MDEEEVQRMIEEKQRTRQWVIDAEGCFDDIPELHQRRERLIHQALEYERDVIDGDLLDMSAQ